MRRVRQAVNYAINRRELARLGDSFQAVPERPTDHYLPPGMPGYRDALKNAAVREPASPRSGRRSCPRPGIGQW